MNSAKRADKRNPPGPDEKNEISAKLIGIRLRMIKRTDTIIQAAVLP
jgi:hypothetical protein